MKNRIYNILFIFATTLLLSLVANNNEKNNFDTLSIEVEECYIPLFFATDDNNNPYDYDVLDDYFVGKTSAHISAKVLKYFIPSYIFTQPTPCEYISKPSNNTDNVLLSWYAESHSRAPTC